MYKEFKEKFNIWFEQIKKYKMHLLFSIIILCAAGILDYSAGVFVETVNTAEVPDFFLSFIPPTDLSLIFTWGYLIGIFVLILYPLFWKVDKLTYILNQFSLLVMIRSIFLCFTHLKAPSTAIAINFAWPFSIISFQNDLFFSGHVAIMFLGFLMFEGKIKYLFLALSIIMAFVVLTMHIHYSIDVFSAFFITYGSYKIGDYFHKKHFSKE